MYSLSKNSCAKAFGNWSRRSDLRLKKLRGDPFDPHPPLPYSPSLRFLELRTYLIYRLLFVQVREVMYRAVQCSELRLNIESKRLSVRVLFPNARSCWPHNEQENVHKALSFISYIFKISRWYRLCNHHVLVFTNKPLTSLSIPDNSYHKNVFRNMSEIPFTNSLDLNFVY